MPALRTPGAIVLVFAMTAAAYPAAARVIMRFGFDQRTGAGAGISSLALLVSAAFNLAIVGAACAIYVFVARRGLGAMGFRFGARDAGFCAVAAGLTGVLAWGFVRTRIEGPGSVAPLLGTVVVALAVAALQEEVVFRGFMVSLLRPTGWAAALLVSTVLFTVVHFLTTQVTGYRTLNWTLGGVSLFAVYFVSGSVWVAVGVHLARNLANSLVLFGIPGVSMVRLRAPLSERSRAIYTLLWSLGIVVLAIAWYGVVPRLTPPAPAT